MGVVSSADASVAASAASTATVPGNYAGYADAYPGLTAASAVSDGHMLKSDWGEARYDAYGRDENPSLFGSGRHDDHDDDHQHNHDDDYGDDDD